MSMEYEKAKKINRGPIAKFYLIKELANTPYNLDSELLKTKSVAELIQIALEEQQKVQMKNPPSSDAWLKAKKRIDELYEQLTGMKIV